MEMNESEKNNKSVSPFQSREKYLIYDVDMKTQSTAFLKKLFFGRPKKETIISLYFCILSLSNEKIEMEYSFNYY